VPSFLLFYIPLKSHLNFRRVFDISIYTCNLEETDKLIYPPAHNQHSYQLFPAPQLLTEFDDGTKHITPEVVHVLRSLARDTARQPDLDLEFSPRFHCFPIISTTIPPFKTTNLVVVVSRTAGSRGRTALVVDPGANAQGKDAFVAILQKLREIGVGELLVFITHHHKDHWEGLPYLAEPAIFAPNTITVIGHALSMDKLDVPFTKKGVDDGDAVIVGDITITVIGTPGHTDNSLSLFHKATG
jgi:Metallo-beta-lactamase superfamily